MPGPHHIVLASGAVMAVSMAVATAIAIYESPELRRYADDVRRRIAMALHTVGDGIDPPHREPLFNRPEDSEGFLESRRGAGAEPGVDADDETRRRQREELLYWNSLRLQKDQDEERSSEPQEKNEISEKPLALEERPRAHTRGSSFDDFLHPDASEQGAYVFNTGSQIRDMPGEVRRRGDGARSLNASLYANPFADEHHLDVDEIEEETKAAHTLAPGNDEVMSDIYSPPSPQKPQPPRAEPPAAAPVAAAVTAHALVDLDESTPSHTATSVTLERELDDDEYMTAGQERDAEENNGREVAYASIQAWAQDSSPDFYSPLPVTPTRSMSEPDVVSAGELTPTDSMSIVGSTEDHDLVSRDGDGEGRQYDVMSESEGMATPSSWSEVGSVVSESDVPPYTV